MQTGECSCTLHPVRSGPHLELIVLLTILDPRLALALWVHEEGVAGCLGDNDAILNRELIVGQSLEVPLANLQKNIHYTIEC